MNGDNRQQEDDERRRVEEEKVNAYADAMIGRDKLNHWLPPQSDHKMVAGILYTRTSAGWELSEQPKGMERK